MEGVAAEFRHLVGAPEPIELAPRPRNPLAQLERSVAASSVSPSRSSCDSACFSTAASSLTDRAPYAANRGFGVLLTRKRYKSLIKLNIYARG